MSRMTIALALLLCVTVRASAQLPADATWRTLETTNFRVTYEEGLEALARRAAAAAERSHAALSIMVARPPRGRIDIIVADHLDTANGWATPFPSNRIALFARPHVDVLQLQYTRDWVEDLVAHELAHIFHLDVSAGVGRFARAVFGRVALPWPLFSVGGTPLWSIEGLAVGVESALGSYGRVNGSYYEMVVRTAALEAEIDDLHRVGSSSAVWPDRTRAYIYGALFMDYLVRRHGPDAMSRIVSSTAGSVIPPQLWFSGVGRSALGVSFQQAYRDWTVELETRYAALSSRLTAEGLTISQPLTTHGRHALYPRFSPDGRLIAYGRNDGRSVSSTTVIDAVTGQVQWTRNRPGVQSLAWLADGAVVTAELQHADRHRVYSDLYVFDSGTRTRLTRGARLHEPDATRDGRIVAVETGGGTNRLVLVDAWTGDSRALTQFSDDVNWSLPRWSPDGARIAASRWSTGGRYDVVVLDTAGVVQVVVTDGIGVNAGATWSPDGAWLLFGSDRSGIPNLYAAAIGDVAVTTGAAPRLLQVTNVLTGAFFPDVSPDGSTIVFARYGHAGYSIERMPFAPESWREPQPASLPQLAAERGAYETAVQPDAFSDSLHAAMAAADTTVHADRAYRAASHMRPHYWLPLISERASQGFFGISTSGADLVDRHTWSAQLGMAPMSGRTIGRLGYTYRGLPTLSGLGLHPTLRLSAERDWERILTDTVGDYRIDRREDRGALTLGLEHVRVRTSTGGSIGAELVRRSRQLDGLPTQRLTKPHDDLIGVTASSWLSTYALPALAVSREDGVSFQLAARQRWDRGAVPATIDGAAALDAGYREIMTSNAAYLALPLPGFARHVLAVRGSALYRTGPGAGRTRIGSISSIDDDDDIDASSGSRLLPVRGFASGTRAGTRGWTVSGEYRFPLTLVARSLSPLPFYVDRLGGSVFVDAGHAWCGAADTARLGSACASTSATDSPLVSAGGELVSFMSFWGVGVPVRIGAGVPLQGAADRSARLYISSGLSF